MGEKMGSNIFASCEILTSAQIRALEGWAMARGVASGAELMERAGAAVAGEIRLRWPKPGRVCVMCGPGNNGGDGYVVARLLHETGWRVTVLGVDSATPPDAAEMKRRWLELGSVKALTKGNVHHAQADVVVDAIFGTGLKRPLEGEIAAIMRYLGEESSWSAQHLVAIDGPSGLCMDSGALLGVPRGQEGSHPRARLTVTFDRPRLGHVLEMGPILCGELVVADIGLNWPLHGQDAPLRKEDIAWVGGPSFCQGESRDLLAIRPQDLGKRRDGHKFSHGHALIVAGGQGQGGAARLAARAALRVGAGLVTIAPPKDAMSEHALPPDALMRRAVDTPEDLAERLKDQRINAVLLGPGCGIERAGELLPALLETCRPCVLDADALTALSLREVTLEGVHAGCVLTPHMGEFARLFPDIAEKLMQPLYSKLDAAREASDRAGCVVLLKGPDTAIAGPGGPAFIQASVYDAAAPWLATAGSGDVLAGIITGLMARGWRAFDAARAGAALHAAAGRSFGPGLIADDLPGQIPFVLRQLGL